MPDDLEYWGCGICIIIWPNSNSFRNILVQLNMVTTKDSILNTLLQCYKIHNLSTYSVVFNYFVFICYKQCFKKFFFFLPSIQHNLTDSGRCRMYKQATSKERAFLRLFHVWFSIQNLTIHTVFPYKTHSTWLP